MSESCPLVDAIVAARRSRTLIEYGPTSPRPVDAEHAYGVQAATLRALGERVGGYKIGAKSPTDVPQFAPLPASHVYQADVGVIRRSQVGRTGLELEIAFQFDGALLPGRHRTEHEVFERVVAMMVSVEILDSRFRQWPQIDRLSQLADLQNNGALITGARVPYDPGFDFLAPVARFSCGPQAIVAGPVSHPAGDPRRLLTWFVNECARRGESIPDGAVLTTGSFSGIYFAEGPDEVVGSIDGIGSLQFSLE